jgi:hypothetical protein
VESVDVIYVKPFGLAHTLRSVSLVLKSVDIRANSHLRIYGCEPLWSVSHLGICDSGLGIRICLG